MKSLPKLLSPAQQRLADLLKFDPLDTLTFMREVFRLSREFDGVSLKEMTSAVQAHLKEFAQVPEPQDVIDRIWSEARERRIHPANPTTNEGIAGHFQDFLFEGEFQSLFALMTRPDTNVDETVDDSLGAPYLPPSDRKGPWLQRLGYLLKLDQMGTSLFVQSLLRLRQQNELFTIADIIAAAEELHNKGAPTSAGAIHELLKQITTEKQEQKSKIVSISRSKGKRNHVSVWEIRN